MKLKGSDLHIDNTLQVTGDDVGVNPNVVPLLDAENTFQEIISFDKGILVGTN